MSDFKRFPLDTPVTIDSMKTWDIDPPKGGVVDYLVHFVKPSPDQGTNAFLQHLLTLPSAQTMPDWQRKEITDYLADIRRYS